MKTLLLYRPNSEHERQALDYLRDFTMQTGKTLPTLDPDSREGVEMCRLYDIMEFPAIIALDGEGHVQGVWTGTLPTYGEVSYYVTDEPSRTA
jgi:hypothetical protein